MGTAPTLPTGTCSRGTPAQAEGSPSPQLCPLVLPPAWDPWGRTELPPGVTGPTLSPVLGGARLAQSMERCLSPTVPCFCHREPQPGSCGAWPQRGHVSHGQPALCGAPAVPPPARCCLLQAPSSARRCPVLRHGSASSVPAGGDGGATAPGSRPSPRITSSSSHHITSHHHITSSSCPSSCVRLPRLLSGTVSAPQQVAAGLGMVPLGDAPQAQGREVE